MEDISTNHDLVTLINNGGDCRTAPATPGLLNITDHSGIVRHQSVLSSKYFADLDLAAQSKTAQCSFSLLRHFVLARHICQQSERDEYWQGMFIFNSVLNTAKKELGVMLVLFVLPTLDK